MSAFPVAHQPTNCQNIPSRRVVLNDASQLPHDCSTTPGGTLFSTTPGGTRIVYDRSFMLNLRQSPLSRTPPKNFDTFPETMVNGSPTRKSSKVANQNLNKLNAGGDQKKNRESSADENQELFHMDM